MYHLYYTAVNTIRLWYFIFRVSRFLYLATSKRTMRAVYKGLIHKYRRALLCVLGYKLWQLLIEHKGYYSGHHHCFTKYHFFCYCFNCRYLLWWEYIYYKTTKSTIMGINRIWKFSKIFFLFQKSFPFL